MIKMIVLLVSIAIGFGIGVYWGVHNPDQARQLAAEEERRFIEAQKHLLERTKRKLDELLARGVASISPATNTSTSAGTAGRSGFVSAAQAARAAPDPEVIELRKAHEEQIREAEKLLKQVGGR